VQSKLNPLIKITKSRIYKKIYAALQTNNTTKTMTSICFYIAFFYSKGDGKKMR
jgi:predicted DNA-binding ArsR family transcriptional regulator